MAHDVFVSYSSEDKVVADGIVAALENNGIRCWYAPRDIKPSDDWGDAIADAIDRSKLLLLVFSGNANQSRHVLDELIVAIDGERTILPFRIENLEPQGAMRLHLSSWHWLDAFLPSWEPFLEELIKNVSVIMDAGLEKDKIQIPESIGKAPGGRKQKKRTWTIAGVIVAAFLIAASWFGFNKLILPSQTTSSAGETLTTDGSQEAEATQNSEYTYEDMVLCYPSIGWEIPWAAANTASIKQAVKDNGVKELIFSNAELNQENQISAIQSCIQQGVSVIALPIGSDDGWSHVLTEVQEAGIPVMIIKEDSVTIHESLYDVHLKIDNFLTGQKSAEEINKLLSNGGNIVELAGSPENEQTEKRASGFRNKLNDNIVILDSQSGNWNKEDAMPVALDFLLKFEGQIDAMFIQNDGMAMGAIEALQIAGFEPGEIKIVAVDGSRDAFQAMIDGWIQAEVETNPLFGPMIIEIALDLMNGKISEREVIIKQNVYYPDEAEYLLQIRVY